jgi:hypothetical protein
MKTKKNPIIDLITEELDFCMSEMNECRDLIIDRIQCESIDEYIAGENYSRAFTEISLNFEDREACEMHAYDLGKLDSLKEYQRRLNNILTNLR